MILMRQVQEPNVPANQAIPCGMSLVTTLSAIINQLQFSIFVRIGTKMTPERGPESKVDKFKKWAIITAAAAVTIGVVVSLLGG